MFWHSAETFIRKWLTGPLTKKLFLASEVIGFKETFWFPSHETVPLKGQYHNLFENKKNALKSHGTVPLINLLPAEIAIFWWKIDSKMFLFELFDLFSNFSKNYANSLKLSLFLYHSNGVGYAASVVFKILVNMGQNLL